MWEEDYYFTVSLRLQYEEYCRGTWDICFASTGATDSDEQWDKYQNWCRYNSLAQLKSKTFFFPSSELWPEKEFN